MKEGGLSRLGLSLPIIQQVPSSASAWEAAAGGPEILAIARAADRLGFRYVSCSDHVAVPASYRAAMGESWYEPAATLGYVAGGTERIGLLTHVLIVAYRHPLIVAKTYATLDRLSGGRVILGVGSGHLKPEFRTLGAPFEERGRATDEAITAIRAAWSDDVASFEGTWARFRDVIVSPRPIQEGGPPIWVGGNSRAAVRRAARSGDGWIPWQITRDDFARARAEGERIRAERGRSGSFEWIAPLRLDLETRREQVSAEIEGSRRAGATGFHLGLAARSLREYLERLEWFATEVAPTVS